MQIRSRRGNGVKGRAEAPWQAQHRDFILECGQCRTLSHKLIDAFQVLEEAQERRLTFQQNGAATLLDQGSITAKLGRVAQPLLGMEENRLAMEGPAAPSVAAGPRGVADARLLPAIFVFRPTVCAKSPVDNNRNE